MYNLFTIAMKSINENINEKIDTMYTKFLTHENNYINNIKFSSLNLEINTLNIIMFTNLKPISAEIAKSIDQSLFCIYSEENIDKFIAKEENIFLLINNPFLKLNMKDIKLMNFSNVNNNINSIQTNIKVLLKKNENHMKNDLIYQDSRYYYQCNLLIII